MFVVVEASLSARRAWIEIMRSLRNNLNRHVALRKESVDRNEKLGVDAKAKIGRSPQGERG